MLIIARTLTVGVLVSVLITRARRGCAKISYCAANPVAAWMLRILSRSVGDLEVAELPNPPPTFPAALITDEQGFSTRSKVQLSVVSMLQKVADARKRGELPAVGGWLSDRERGPLLLHLSLLAAKQLLDYAFLGQYALSNLENRSGGSDGEVVVLVPRKWWRRLVEDWLAASPVRVTSPIIPEVPFESLLVRARERCRRVADAVADAEPVEWFQPEFVASFPKPARNDLAGQATRVGVLLLDSIDPRRRCNASWYWSTEFRRNDVVFLIWDHLTSECIPQEVISSVREAGGTIYRQGTRMAKTHPGVPRWRASAYGRSRFVIARLAALVSHIGLRSAFRAGFLWHLSATIRLIVKASWWYDFFKRNEIKIFVEVEEGTDAATRALAMKALGGVVVVEQRSSEYDHFQFFAERYADLFLYSGVHDLRQTVDLSNKQSVALTGFPSSTMALSRLPSIDNLRSHFKKDLPVITFVDEAGSIYGFSEVKRAYRAILEDLDTSGGFSLLVKSKRLSVFRAATSGLESQIRRLLADGKLTLFDPACPVAVPFSISDAVVTLPSTAMFEAIHLGCRTAILNPYRTMRNLFYSHGFAGTVVFEDPENLLRQLRGFLSGSADTFGDCSTFLCEIDPYGDRDGVSRTARLMDVLRDAFRDTPSVQEAIHQTLSNYGRDWGDGVAGSGEDLIGQAQRPFHSRSADSVVLQ